MRSSTGSCTERLALGPRWRFWRRRRLCVAALALLGFVHLYTARVNLSVAIVHMTTTSRRGSADDSPHNATADAYALVPLSDLRHAPPHRAPAAPLQPPAAHVARASAHGTDRRQRRHREVDGIPSPELRRVKRDTEDEIGDDNEEDKPNYVTSDHPMDGGLHSAPKHHISAPEFNWDSRSQGWLLSAFFYGYAASQVPAGLVARRAGAARLFGVSVGASSALALLSPPAARLGGFYALLTLRVILGLFGGLSLPAMSALWARWAPPTERARLASLAASGTNVGTVLVFFLSGALAINFGWPSIFYVFGTLGLLWLVAWLAMVFEGPEEDPNTPQEELQYLRASLLPLPPTPPPSPPTPAPKGSTTKTQARWKAMVCSPPLLALTVAHVAHNWGAVTFLMQLPRYLHEVHLLEVGHMGTLAAVPYVLLAASLPGAGLLSDTLVRSEMMSVTHARKVMLGGTLAMQSLLMLVVAHARSRGMVLGCVLAVVATGAFPRAALLVNHLDLSPRHAGVLMGVTNSLATLPGIISPVITGFLVTGQDPREWVYVFYIMSALYAVGAIAFIAFGSAELQPWAAAAPDDG